MFTIALSVAFTAACLMACLRWKVSLIGHGAMVTTSLLALNASMLIPASVASIWAATLLIVTGQIMIFTLVVLAIIRMLGVYEPPHEEDDEDDDNPTDTPPSDPLERLWLLPSQEADFEMHQKSVPLPQPQ